MERTGLFDWIKLSLAKAGVNDAVFLNVVNEQKLVHIPADVEYNQVC